jgi:hypothetical protein
MDETQKSDDSMASGRVRHFQPNPLRLVGRKTHSPGLIAAELISKLQFLQK